MAANEVAVGKRLEIKTIRRQIFITVAGAAAIFGIIVVIAIFLVKTIIFNQKVMGAQRDSIAVMDANIAAVKNLDKQITELRTNQNLETVAKKLDPLCLDVDGNLIDFSNNPSRAAACSALRVVADSIPMESASTVSALGASLTELLRMNEPLTQRDSSSVGRGRSTMMYGINAVDATFSVNGSTYGVNSLLQILERSVRPFSISTASFEWRRDGRMALSVRSNSFFVSPSTVTKKSKSVGMQEAPVTPGRTTR